MLIAQLSDVHVGGSRYREELLRTAIDEVNLAGPDLVVLAGDLTDVGYPDQYPLAVHELAALACPRIVRVPGNHDALPRDWPADLSARDADPFVGAARGVSLANADPTPPEA